MGSKRAMTFLAFPAIAYWILVKFGNTFYYLLLARFITGWTVGGMQSGVALYVAEISNDNIRGRLGSITPLGKYFFFEFSYQMSTIAHGVIFSNFAIQ